MDYYRNIYISSYRRIERVAGCRRVASFRNYPGLSSATDYRLIVQVRNIPGNGKGRDRGSFLSCKCFSIFLALPPFWNLLCPERSKFSWTGREQYPPHGTIVSRDFSPARAFFRNRSPNWQIIDECGTHTHIFALASSLTLHPNIHPLSARLN